MSLALQITGNEHNRTKALIDDFVWPLAKFSAIHGH